MVFLHELFQKVNRLLPIRDTFHYNFELLKDDGGAMNVGRIFSDLKDLADAAGPSPECRPPGIDGRGAHIGGELSQSPADNGEPDTDRPS